MPPTFLFSHHNKYIKTMQLQNVSLKRTKISLAYGTRPEGVKLCRHYALPMAPSGPGMGLVLSHASVRLQTQPNPRGNLWISSSAAPSKIPVLACFSIWSKRPLGPVSCKRPLATITASERCPLTENLWISSSAIPSKIPVLAWFLWLLVTVQ